MPRPTFLSRPLRNPGVAARPAAGLRAAAKTISRVDPSIVVPAATDPCALVILGSDFRLRLATLADETGVVFGDLAVVRLATGCVELAPAEGVEPGVLKPLRVDTQRLSVPLFSYCPSSQGGFPPCRNWDRTTIRES